MVVVFSLLPLVGGAPESWLLYVFLFLVYLAMANMWNLLARVVGLIFCASPRFSDLQVIR